MAVYLYSPPTWRNVVQMESALRVGVPTSTVVYRQAGVWFNTMTAGMDDPVIAACDVLTIPGAGTLRLFFNKPMVVPDLIHDELAALEAADSSWTPGSLTLL